VIGVAVWIGLSLAPLSDERLPDAALPRLAESAFRQGTASRSNPAQARASFARAAAAFDELGRRGFRSAALCFNQGNAYFLAGDLPRAILAYRRGLRLAPNSLSKRTNLALARQQVEHPLATTADRWPWLPRPAPRWLWLGLVGLYGLAGFAFARWWMVRRNGLLLVGLFAALGVLVTAGGLILAEVDRRQDLAHPLVVIARDQVQLRKGNGYRYPVVDETPLNRGVEARWLFSRSDWLQIELADGKVGWIPHTAALVDEP
jgi:hypothetical protein